MSKGTVAVTANQEGQPIAAAIESESSTPISQSQPLKLRKPFLNSQTAATVNPINQIPNVSVEPLKKEAVSVTENHGGTPKSSVTEADLSETTSQPQPFKLRKAFQDSQTAATIDTTNQSSKLSVESAKEDAVVVTEKHDQTPPVTAIDKESSAPTTEPQPFRLRKAVRHSQTIAVTDPIEEKPITPAKAKTKELVATNGHAAGEQTGTAIDSMNSIPSGVSKTINVRKAFDARQTTAETIPNDRQPQSPARANKDTIVSDNQNQEIASDSVVQSFNTVPAESTRSFKLRKTFHESPTVTTSTEKQAGANAADTSNSDPVIASVEMSEKAIVEGARDLAEVTPQYPAKSLKLRTAFRDSQSKIPLDAPHKVGHSSSSDLPVVSSQAETPTDEEQLTTKSELIPAKPLEPFKLRKKIEPSVSNMNRQRPSLSPRMDKSESDVATVAASDEASAAIELPVERITNPSESHGSAPIKLRASFRDPQLTKSVVESGHENSSTPSPSKNVVVVNHEVPIDSATRPADAASKEKSEVSGAVKLRPSFRNSSIKSSNEALKESIPNPPSKVETTTSTNQQVRHESIVKRRSAGELIASNQDPSSKSDLQKEDTNKSAKRSLTATSASPETMSFASAATVAKSPQAELRASAWDNAVAPTSDSQPAKLKLRPDPTKPVPVPTKVSESLQTSQAPVGGQASTAATPSEQPTAEVQDSSSIDSALLGAADFKNSTQSRQKRPYAPEDDQAASTRAILRSGPVQGLAQLTGVPKSTASAMLGAFGLSLVIAGLWLIRTTMRIRQA
jgi:hypothetical protein